ncbi:flavin reductase [Citricoccus sp. SGAir0253]|uniref:flavin reductase family protein n=1 Tax=Citricoccus sp. SGAir0253 TaxID=2567881 RepID=UPI0010CD325A|nr:flavin reductase family protein [Citricoccus sp. SGAir0253]QCU77107.1 flavin reductase [Citricoccus sp. SGAir0253]
MSDTTLDTPTTFDPRAFRDVLGHYPTGVVVVTAMVDAAPVGMVVGTFSSVSLEPPLVSFMPMTSSSSYAKLRAADRVCISVFAHDQLQACRTLASKDPEKFDKVEWTPSAAGAPMIADAVAHIHGRIEREVEAGDHYITLVAVDDVAVNRPVTPLLFFQGGYGGFSTTGLAAHVDESLISAVRVAEAARPQLDRLARRFGCSAAALVQVSAVDQTIGATSYGGDSDADERIGVRVPLIPPLGEAAVAWSAEQVDRWVSRIFPQDEQVIARYREAAERVRTQGYAISRVDHDPEGYAALGEALGEYAHGELTPARDRAVRAAIAGAGHFFGGSITDSDSSIDLASVVVPVFSPDADEPRNSGLVLRLCHLPAGVDAPTVREWIHALQEAAREVAETLRTTARKDHARYAASGLRTS